MNFDSKQQSLLTFRVGPVLCCAPSLPVRSIITPPKLTQTPGCDASQPGIFKHGSHIVKVLDLRQKFGIDQAEQTQPGNLIITIFEKESFAFWVDQILDVFDFPSEGWGNLPAAIPRGVFTRTLLLNKKIHLYSEFENLATIQDLGYLKHYIQQLKQEEDKKTIEKPVTSKLSKPKNTNDNKVSSEALSQIETDEINTDSPIQKISDKNPIENNKVSTSPSLSKINKNDVITKSDDKTSSNIAINNNKIESRETKPITPTNLKTFNRNTLNEHNVKTSYTNHKSSAINENAVPLTEKLSSQNTNSKSSADNFSTPKTQEFTSNTKIDENNSEEESSSAGIIIFLLLILGLFAAGFYYMFDDIFTSPSKYKKQKPVYSAPIIHNPIETKEDEPVPVTTEKNQIEEISTENISNENSTDIPLKENMAEAAQEPIADNEYRAEIIQQENEITITIHEPVAIEKIKPEETAVPVQEIEKVKDEITVTPEPVEALKPTELVEKIPPKKIINEVIHIVVKGDTLWAIAKKYVDDPFLYPELARLSNIRNPHRIYPGNRVRIRFIKN